ncbi:hypothetical protein BUE93_21385 [Chromobacterium amazonense]|uniref:Uncharacterized protein n=1 Tax=Chromobacterium amazonense TaxID=1382803 RepID=A0A2S9WYP8_9NEIS|nr:hypothetical protein [Chromobacterium amazonense]PRP68597.1 hypothetical protein BUE93_21385 [Chromobacterium amazonense]
MTNEELESVFNQLAGKQQGLQTLIYALIVSSHQTQRQHLLKIFKAEAESRLAVLNAESMQSDETLEWIAKSFQATIEWLEEINDLPL